jgi:hypothetical protein
MIRSIREKDFWNVWEKEPPISATIFQCMELLAFFIWSAICIISQLIHSTTFTMHSTNINNGAYLRWWGYQDGLHRESS